MFSYRHGFHAGNHADVLKHMVLIAILRHLTAKDTPISVVAVSLKKKHYRLDDDFTATSGEAEAGIFKLLAAIRGGTQPSGLLADYVDRVSSFNKPGEMRIYPGSPFVAQSLLRDAVKDKLHLFEMHPTDSKALATHVEQLNAARQVTIQRADGFEGLKAKIPPPSRRGLLLVDPSYEIKSDYAKVPASLADSLKRFATGTYMIWYPGIPRPEAHDLPRRLKTLCNNLSKPWLHAVLNIGHVEHVPGSGPQRHGLTASGVFVVNPPHTLKTGLKEALPQLVEVLGQGRGQSHVLESS